MKSHILTNATKKKNDIVVYNYQVSTSIPKVIRVQSVWNDDNLKNEPNENQKSRNETVIYNDGWWSVPKMAHNLYESQVAQKAYN